MKLHRLTLFLLLGIAGCKKYDIAPLVKDPAYMRVFNNLTTSVNVLNNQQVTPFLTFLMDPKTDARGLPNDAEVIGDFLGTRQLFSLSYPVNAANSSTGNTTTGSNGQPGLPNLNPVNFEYPGNAYVLTASYINGFDLSAWAQIPSGKHRIMFVVRPQNNVAFKDLSTAQRSSVLLDTTVNFEKGEVYTLEVVSRDLDNNKYGLYIRKEQFIHQAFDVNKIYTGFVNLSGKKQQAIKNGYGFVYGDNVQINYSYYTYNDGASSGTGNIFYNTLPGYDNTYFGMLTTKMDTVITFQPMPLLPESSFYYQGLIRTYANPINQNLATDKGTFPYFNFTLLDADKPDISSKLSFAADPATFNNFTPVTGLLPNLNLIVNTGHTYHVYSTINIMEIEYDRVYMMQIQRGFDEVPNN